MGRSGHRGFLSLCGGLGIGLLAGFAPLARAEESAAPPAGQVAGSGGADTEAVISDLVILVSGQADEIAELKREIGDLTTLIEGDRARLDALEKAQGEPHKAPFTVVNDAGELLFNVASSDVGAMVNIFGQSQIDLVAGGTARIALASDTQEATIAVDDGGIRQTFGPTRGDPNLEIALDGGGIRLSLGAGEGRVTLTASDDEAGMRATGKGRDLYFGSFAEFSGLRFFNRGKIGVALSDGGGGPGRYALGFFADGSSRADLVAGYHKDGRLAFSLWEGDNPLVRIDAGNDTGSGAVRLYDSGKEAVTLGKVGLDMLGMSVDSAGASLLAGIDGTEQVFSFGTESAPLFSARAGAGGSTATLTLGKDLAVLRTTDDGAGELTLGTPSGTVARLGTDADGQGDLTLSDAGSPFADLGQIGGIGSLSLMEGEAPAITLGRTAERTTVAFRAWYDGQMVVGAGRPGKARGWSASITGVRPRRGCARTRAAGSSSSRHKATSSPR